MTRKNYRRRNYLIKKSFQTKFSIRFAALVVLEALLITWFFFHIASGTLTTGYFGGELKIESTRSFFYFSFIGIMLIATVAIGLIGMVVFIVYSHRLAGPLFRFQRTLEQMTDGDLTIRFQLRQNDQLSDLGNALKIFTKSIDDQMSEFKKEIHLVSELSEKPESAPKLKKHIGRLKEIADTFKTSS